jgi:hypothetical protein
LRCAVQAGLTPEQLRGTAGGQLAHIVRGEAPPDLGPPPMTPRALDPTLERVVAALCATVSRVFVQADSSETLALARLACAVADDDPVAPTCAQTVALLDLYEAGLGAPPPYQPFPESIRYLIAAVFVARTPDAG